jgi:hypothetical protein
MKVFRLHWTEEAQHARIDAIHLRRLADKLTEAQIFAALSEFVKILLAMRGIVRQQDALDLDSFEKALGRSFSPEERTSLLYALDEASTWTYFMSGLEHPAFRAVYEDLVPAGGMSIDQVKAQLVQVEN